MVTYNPEDLIPPCRIADGLYFVGTVPNSSSSHLIDTGDGLILIDSGYPFLMDKVLDNIREVGYDPADIKILLISHGHIDHMGSSLLLRERYGTKLYVGEKDGPYCTGEKDLTWANETGVPYELPFVPDVLMKDGDTVELGNVKITCLHTPGHTEGTTSFVFDAYENGKKYTCAMFGGAGLNSVKRSFLEKYGLPLSLREDYRASLHRLAKLDVDIMLGNHPHNNATRAKVNARLTDPDGPNPFIKPGELRAFVGRCEKNLDKQIAEDDAAAEKK